MSKRRQTAIAVIDGYNQWSMPAIMAVRDASYIHEVLPKSLGQPPMDRQTYEAYFSGWIPAFRNFTVTINDIYDDEKQNKVVVWASSSAETDIGPYANEYMLVLHFNEAQDKITRMLEFVDSANSAVFFPKLAKYLEDQAAKSKGDSEKL